MLNFVAGNRKKLLKFLSVQSVLFGICSKVLIQFMSKLVKPDTSDVLSTSTTVSSVFAVSLTKNFDVLQKCMCPGFCKAYSHV